MLLGAVACASSGPTTANPASLRFAPAALDSATSDSGALQLTLRAQDTGIVRGVNAVELTVQDAASSQPVDGLTMTVTPWMPTMGHGTSVVPTVTALGSGRYVATDVDLFMPGTWDLHAATQGQTADTTVLSVVVR